MDALSPRASVERARIGWVAVILFPRGDLYVPVTWRWFPFRHSAWNYAVSWRPSLVAVLDRRARMTPHG